MLSDFLQDKIINKLNGYFLIFYATDHIKLALMIEFMNDFLVFILEVIHLIPPRRRLA